MIRYRFHPRAGERFRIARRLSVHNEPCFVLRPASAPHSEAQPLAVPVWMTEEASAKLAVVSAARVPITVLSDLRALVDAGLSSFESTLDKGGHNAGMQDSAMRSVRRRSAGRGTDAATGSTGGSTAGFDAVAVRSEQGSSTGGRR